MEQLLSVLKISAVTTPLILVIVALVQLGKLKQDHERTKSVLKAVMKEIDRLQRKLPDSEQPSD